MEISYDWKTAIISLLTVIVLVGGAYFYRGYEMQAQRRMLTATENVLNQLQLTPQLTNTFRQIGYNIKVQPAVLPPVVEEE